MYFVSILYVIVTSVSFLLVSVYLSTREPRERKLLSFDIYIVNNINLKTGKTHNKLRMSDKYVDPENIDDIIEQIKECKMHNDVMDLIIKTFPTWILGYPKKYSDDYPSLTNNWNFICEKIGCKPLNVIIVDSVQFEEYDKDNNHKLIRLFADILTRFGHSVRRSTEFIGCKVCGDAIPNQNLYNEMVSRKVPTPSCWRVKCEKC